MSNPQKRKGTDFEKQVVELLNGEVKDGVFKRVPGSGALGTILDEPGLTADVKGKIPSIPKGLRIECKSGYNTSSNKEAKSLGLKKQWLDKVIAEAESTYELPLLMGKFLGAREGVKVFAVMDINTFTYLLNRITELHDEINRLSTTMATN
jgi:hypothetical protein